MNVESSLDNRPAWESNRSFTDSDSDFNVFEVLRPFTHLYVLRLIRQVSVQLNVCTLILSNDLK